MRLLLDSHTFLWWVADDKRLSARIRRVIAASASECWLSHASVWEMTIKASLGKLILDCPVEKFVAEQCEINGIRLLPITFKHVCAVENLPWHHRDPFDRLLISQALAENLVLATRDTAIKRYGVSVI
ncbi:MAG: type II toxin-antitoxin system VapC family toxin [Gammaproteobacteria bacterium]|nr:type II toxin-antitoxin system VapC family toxin [Gammaproteobacteria bacterium]